MVITCGFQPELGTPAVVTFLRDRACFRTVPFTKNSPVQAMPDLNAPFIQHSPSNEYGCTILPRRAAAVPRFPGFQHVWDATTGLSKGHIGYKKPPPNSRRYAPSV